MAVSWKSVGAALTAAAVLVVGVDVVTYAATGDSLVLGRTNVSHGPTELVNRGRGPALVLKDRHNNRPSLRVSSKAKVPRLNADRVDGRDASQLATRAVSYLIGRPGDVLPSVGVWPLEAAPGLYQVTFKVLARPDTSPDLVSGMICGVIDLDSFGDNTKVYTADTGNLLDGDDGPPIAMSGAEMVRIKRTENPGVFCGSNGPDYTLDSASASLTPINARTIRRATPAPLPSPRRMGRLAIR